jgi:hypothetical protein
VSVPDDRLLDELIDTNRELVAVNRQIAESLANIERLYLEQHDRQRETQQYYTQTMERFRKTNHWSFHLLTFLPLAVILAVMIFQLVRG